MSLRSWCVRHAARRHVRMRLHLAWVLCSRVHRPAAPSIGRSAVLYLGRYTCSHRAFFLLPGRNSLTSRSFGQPVSQSFSCISSRRQAHLALSSQPRRSDSSTTYHVFRTAILSPNAAPLMQLAWPPPMSPSVLVPKTHQHQHANSNSSGRSHRFQKCPTFRRTTSPSTTASYGSSPMLCCPNSDYD